MYQCLYFYVYFPKHSYSYSVLNYETISYPKVSYILPYPFIHSFPVIIAFFSPLILWFFSQNPICPFLTFSDLPSTFPLQKKFPLFRHYVHCVCHSVANIYLYFHLPQQNYELFENKTVWCLSLCLCDGWDMLNKISH